MAIASSWPGSQSRMILCFTCSQSPICFEDVKKVVLGQTFIVSLLMFSKPCYRSQLSKGTDNQPIHLVLVTYHMKSREKAYTHGSVLFAPKYELYSPLRG